jgi:phosphoribosylamine--glycine ligase
MGRQRKVVVIGSGAREHALVRALLRGAATGDPREVVAIPGNAGIAREARCVPSGSSAQDLCAAAVSERPDLVVVGPEAPLAAGLADLLAAAKVPCFGPSAAAARIEASKAFAKEVMRAASVPTAEGALFDDPARAREHVRTAGACVVKLDGLAAGKGVVVADDSAQAAAAVDELWALAAAQAGGERRASPPRLLIEERLEGKELSVIGLCDGETVLALPPARDHKRLGDGDRGPNTGGMGAVSPPRDATAALVSEVVRTVLEPAARELARRGTPFRGAL